MVVVAACFATVAVAATDVVVADSAVVNGDSTVEVIATAGLVVVAAAPVDVVVAAVEVVVVVAAAVDIFVVVVDGDTLDASFIFGAKAKWQKFFRSDAGAASGKRPMPSGYLDGRWERKIKVEKNFSVAELEKMFYLVTTFLEPVKFKFIFRINRVQFVLKIS